MLNWAEFNSIMLLYNWFGKGKHIVQDGKINYEEFASMMRKGTQDYEINLI
jgi:hypothetical protein